MEIFQDEDELPRRRKTVSFGKRTTRFDGRKPFSQHNKLKSHSDYSSEKNPTFKKQPSRIPSVQTSRTRWPSNARENGSTSTTKSNTVSLASSTKPRNSMRRSRIDKENVGATSRASSLRKSLRETMVSPPSQPQDTTTSMVAKSSHRKPLRPSNVLGPVSASSKTHPSMAQNTREEKAESKPSTRNRTFLSSVPPNNNSRTPRSLLKPEMEMMTEESSLLMSPNDAKPEKIEGRLERMNNVPERSLNVRSFIQQRRAELKQKKPVQGDRTTARSTDEIAMTRGNGLELDLSNTLSQIHSPIKESPQRPNAKQAPEPPVAVLGNFPKGLWLDFGDETANVVGKTRSLPIIIQAPPNVKDYCVKVDKVPLKTGFDLAIVDSKGENGKKTFFMNGGERQQLDVAWNPTMPGGVKEVLLLKLPRGRLRIDVHGRARDGIGTDKNEPRKKINISGTGNIVPSEKIKNLVAPASTTWELETSLRTPARSPKVNLLCTTTSPISQSGCRRMANGKSWAAQQCESFTNWLNYTFQPTEDDDHETSLQGLQQKENACVSTSYIALRTLVLHQRMSQVRQKGLELFNSQEMLDVKKIIHVNVDKGRLSVRVDRDMYADLNLRDKATSLLLSYSTPWLRLGLETLFGENISLESPNHSSPHKATLDATGRVKKVPLSPMKLALKKFIVNRVLSDPSTLMKYTKGKCNVPSGVFEKKYRAESRRHALYQLLVLIVFLDRAKRANIVERVPHLFMKGARVKSSREVIVALCRDFLSSEGDIIKHLSRIGVKVCYKQEYIDEIDFTITNLAVDLRDGIRLARLIEILRQERPKSLLKVLRLPAVSRLQKLHNVGVVLDSIRESRVPNTQDIAPHHIVDGHREMVLKLLWSVASFFKLESLAEIERIDDEIQSVRQSQRFVRNAMHDLSNDGNVCKVTEKSGNHNNACLKASLLRWCQTVCRCFGFPITDFTTSFADGKALCYLLHYYHPVLLRHGDILSTTRDLPQETNRGSVAFRNALDRERQNALLANIRMSELGGIPQILPVSDSENVPEETTMVLCLAYLFSRLVESSKEVLATVSIQHAYRRYRAIVDLEKKRVAASVVLIAWRSNKGNYYAAQRRQFSGAVQVLEKFFLSSRSRLRAIQKSRLELEQKVQAAIFIQKHARSMIMGRATKTLVQQQSAARFIQTMWRATAARKEHCLLKRLHSNSGKIQRAWRGYQCRLSYLRLLRAVPLVQSSFRGYCLRQRLKEWNESAFVLQRFFRSFLAAVDFQTDLLDIITVQSVFRRRMAVRRYRQHVGAVVRLQQGFRCLIAKRIANAKREEKASEARLIETVVLCQCVARRYLALRRVQLLSALIFAALQIQSCWRARSAIRNAARRKHALTTIQCAFRCRKAARRVESLRTAMIEQQQRIAGVIACQAIVRRHFAIKCAKVIREKIEASTTIQTKWRAHRDIASFCRKQDATVKLQSCFRRYVARCKRNLIHRSATSIQQSWRTFAAVRDYQQAVGVIVYCQSVVRGGMVRNFVKKRKLALLCLQCSARVWLAFRRLNALHDKREEESRAVGSIRRVCAKRLQACYRGYAVRRNHDFLNDTAITIQRVWRGYIWRIEYYMDLMDIIVVQSVARRRIARIELEKRMEAALLVQQGFRRFLALRTVDDLRHRKREQRREVMACILIQTVYRQKKARIQFLRHRSATTIQKSWRCKTLYLDYKISLLSTFTIQAYVRRFLTLRKHERALRSTVLIQSFARGVAIRKLMASLKASLVLLQAYGRSFLASRSYHRHRHAAILVQGVARRFLVRGELSVQNLAATEIQRHWRGYRQSVCFMLHLIMAIKIQSLFRKSVALKAVSLAREEAALRYFMAGRIQRAFKSYSYRKRVVGSAYVLQKWIRRRLSFLQRHKMVTRVTLIQSIFRGHVVRRSCSKKVRTIATQVETANVRARKNPMMQLGARTDSALYVVQNSKRLAEITDAVKTLEMSTRLSEVCCVAFTETDATETLYQLISTCNRSRPHIELILWVLRTLANVAEYDFLLPILATKKSVDGLIDLVQMFRDKEEPFCLAVHLLARTLFCSENLKARCRSKEKLKLLKCVHIQCERKARASTPHSTIKQSVVVRRSLHSQPHDMKWGIKMLGKIILWLEQL